MKLYKLAFVLHEPSEDTENMYLAESTGLAGCRAWGKTAAEAIENLQSVATAFIESYRSSGDPLPVDVEAAADEVFESNVSSELLVAV